MGLEGVLEREVDALAQQQAQLLLESRQLQQRRRLAELYQHINVASASRLAACV